VGKYIFVPSHYRRIYGEVRSGLLGLELHKSGEANDYVDIPPFLSGAVQQVVIYKL
jgi:hypothetical protein